MTRLLVAVSGLLIAVLITQTIAAEEWALKGDMAESCCCQPGCPCVFNSAPTLGYCEGSTLFEIKEGHYGDVYVDEINVVIAYRFGEWLRLYVDDKATDEQMGAVANLLNQDTTFGLLFAGNAKLLSVEKTEISVKKSTTTIEFSVPDSKVELEVMAGPSGKPIRIENLSVPWFANGYTQYKATTTRHRRGDTEFEYSGTNGATSHIDVRGKVGGD